MKQVIIKKKHLLFQFIDALMAALHQNSTIIHQLLSLFRIFHREWLQTKLMQIIMRFFLKFSKNYDEISKKIEAKEIKFLSSEMGI